MPLYVGLDVHVEVCTEHGPVWFNIKIKLFNSPNKIFYVL